METKGISWERTLKTKRMKLNEKSVIILLSKDIVYSFQFQNLIISFKDSETSLTRLLCGV
nr:MAG TPA: hypothetical protein [Caudoviricetes sp.]